MDTNTAYAYRLDDEYTSIYVNLNGYEQIIFYWSTGNDCQKRKPKWRISKETIEQGMRIISYTPFGLTVEIDGKLAKFDWYEYERDILRLRGPNHKAKLTNFADWAVVYDSEYKNNSPTSAGNHYAGSYNGHYGQPQEYNAEDDDFTTNYG